jgi:hypothetical protein
MSKMLRVIVVGGVAAGPKVASRNYPDESGGRESPGHRKKGQLLSTPGAACHTSFGRGERAKGFVVDAGWAWCATPFSSGKVKMSTSATPRGRWKSTGRVQRLAVEAAGTAREYGSGCRTT